MDNQQKRMEILNNMIGDMTLDMAAKIQSRIDCFLHKNVSLFVPTSGQCVYAITPSHVHPSYLFVYYFNSAEIIIEGESQWLDNDGTACLIGISPGIPHQELEQEFFESYIAVGVDASYFEQIWSPYSHKLPVLKGESMKPHPELLSVLRCFMMERGTDNCESTEFLDTLAAAIVHLVARSVEGGSLASIPLFERFEVDQAIAYMNSHLAEKITVEHLAKQVNRSAGHFAKIFKSVTGETPTVYLNKMRMEKARILLMKQEKNMTEIALSCGFTSSSYFSVCFLEKYKMSPREFRKKIAR